MTREQFKLIHSELIQQVQCVEYNLKVIYAAMRKPVSSVSRSCKKKATTSCVIRKRIDG
jgi:hypothetical protein